MKQNSSSSKEPNDQFSVISQSTTHNQPFESPPQPTTSPSSNRPYCLIIAFVILGTHHLTSGFYFIVFGIVQLSTNFSEVNYRIHLVRNGNQYTSENTFISFKQNTSVLLYLQMQDFTQLDQSFSIDQQIKRCLHYKTNFEMKKTFSINGTPLNPQADAVPCGRHASFYPEGKFEIINTEHSTPLQISTSQISFTNQNHFSSSDIDPSVQWINFENERFRNWMTLDANEKIKKLWGRISEAVSGNYQIKLTVNNEMPEVSKLYISLGNNEALGGYNSELCYLNFFYAIMLFGAALANFLIQSKWGHRKVLKKKPSTSVQGNQIKIYLNSAASTPAGKFD